MSEKVTRQYGLWESPIRPGGLARVRRLDGACWDSDGETLVWLEGRSGHGTLLAQGKGDQAPRELTDDINVRAEVGYGGGDFTVHGGNVYFVECKTGRIYRQSITSGQATPISPAWGKAASPTVSPNGCWLAYVHHDDDDNDRIVVVDVAGKHLPRVLTSGHDFYMQPRWSPDGQGVAWIAWDHPNMPWDGTVLEFAPIVSNDDEPPRLGAPKLIAGGCEAAVFQPEFTPDGKQILYVSDETGWGRIAIRSLANGEQRWLTPPGKEFASPAWLQDRRTYAISGDQKTVVASGNENGFQSIVTIDLASGEMRAIESLSQYSETENLVAAMKGNRFAFIASCPTTSARVVACDLRTNQSRIVARSSGETISQAALSGCEAISWATAGGETAHGLFYPPASERFRGTGKPPLMVLVHGGPTSQVRAGWKPDAQFFATRGYAVLFVNYRGGTGYGREYMLRLRGNWGICDVEDSISGARHLVDNGQVDPDRTVIMGGSAGGFTVLQTMSQHPDAFAAGINLFGVSDQFHLVANTHKFESRYTDTLLGPLPEASKTYRERSPLFHADNIRRPLAVFQGDEDKVVPRKQSDAIVEVLRRNGVPHEYHVYDGEGHGWRKRETIEHFYNAVDAFLKQYVLFT